MVTQFCKGSRQQEPFRSEEYLQAIAAECVTEPSQVLPTPPTPAKSRALVTGRRRFAPGNPRRPNTLTVWSRLIGALRFHDLEVIRRLPAEFTQEIMGDLDRAHLFAFLLSELEIPALAE